jgi:hypothetical protein
MNPANIQFHIGGNPMPPTSWKQWVTNFLRTLNVDVTEDNESYVDRQNANGMNPTIHIGLGGVSGSAPDTTGATKYMVYQITDDTTTPPTAGFDWVRAHG